MFCPNCGNKIQEGVKFCPYCGVRLVLDKAKPEKGTLTLLLGILLGISIIAIAITTTVIISEDKVEGTWSKPLQGRTLPFWLVEVTKMPAIEQIKIVKKKINKKKGDCEVKIEYPQLEGMSNLVLQAQINSFLRDKVESKLGFNLDAIECKEDESTYYKEIGFRINYNKNSLLSITIDETADLGGVHPSHEVDSYNINLEDGKILKLTDLFTEAVFEKLSNLATSKAIAQYGDLSEAGFFVEKIPIDHDTEFYILQDGVVFHFDEYEIAPYATGTVEIKLPWKEIRDLIKTSSVIYNLFKL